MYIFIQYHPLFFNQKLKLLELKICFFVSNSYDDNLAKCLITRITKTERFSHCT